MVIEKIWIDLTHKKCDFILFNQDVIYQRYVSLEEVEQVSLELDLGEINEKFVGLPMSYITKIEYREEDKMLNISYNKDSTESIVVDDDVLRKEIFDYIADNTKISELFVKKPSILSRIKKPLLALIVVVAIFMTIYYMIIGIEKGYDYEVSGLLALVFGLATMGLTKNSMIFLPLGIIALVRIIVNIKKNSEIHYIVYSNETKL